MVKLGSADVDAWTVFELDHTHTEPLFAVVIFATLQHNFVDRTDSQIAYQLSTC